MVVRVTGNLGPDHPVDVTFVGIGHFLREFVFGTAQFNGGPYPVQEAVQGTIRGNISLVADSYQISFASAASSLDAKPNGFITANSSLVLKSGETASVASDDGLINLKVTLTEVPNAGPPAGTGGSPTQNFTVNIQGALAPDIPVNVALTTTMAGLGQGVEELYQVAAVPLANSPASHASNRVTIMKPAPSAAADPGTYQVGYSADFSINVPTTTPSGSVIVLGGGDDLCSGSVLLKVGQTITVQDAQGLGSLNITLTSAAY